MAWARSRLFSEKFFKDLAKQLSKDEIEDEDADTLCDCQFTLAYGNKILLFDTRMCEAIP